jgi:SP family facilitated glucose transporter-like MFS transporter 8
MCFCCRIVAGAGAGNADKVTIYVAVMQVASTAVCVGFLDKIGRKPLLIASCLGIAVCNLMLAACYSEIGTKVFGAHKGLVASVTVNALISFFGVGVGTIPWLLMAEILPSRVRGLGSSFATALHWLVAFMVTTSFGPLCSLIGTAKVYLLVFTPVILAFAGFVVVCVPETTGRSLDEIQRMLYERLGPQ